MPYLRLYLPETSTAQKRHIAQKMIDTTLGAFRLPTSDREQITVQFLSQPRQRGECRIEVLSRDLPADRKQAFAEAVSPMLIESLHLQVKNRLAWLMGVEAKVPPKVEVQFLGLPFDDYAASEPMVGDAIISEWKKAA
jgi:phenylpyruvate tautomerase PptA (4-oxalocrotonate tautomerase family)